MYVDILPQYAMSLKITFTALRNFQILNSIPGIVAQLITNIP